MDKRPAAIVYNKIVSTIELMKTLKPNEIGNIELDIPINSANKKQPKKDLIFLFVLITYIFTFFLLRKFKI